MNLTTEQRYAIRAKWFAAKGVPDTDPAFLCTSGYSDWLEEQICELLCRTHDGLELVVNARTAQLQAARQSRKRLVHLVHSLLAAADHHLEMHLELQAQLRKAEMKAFDEESGCKALEEENLQLRADLGTIRLLAIHALDRVGLKSPDFTHAFMYLADAVEDARRWSRAWKAAARANRLYFGFAYQDVLRIVKEYRELWQSRKRLVRALRVAGAYYRWHRGKREAAK